jgi:Lsr2
MATRTVIQLLDDLTGGTAAETVTFGLDGKHYEIDLSSDNAAQLRARVEPFAKAARKTGGKTKPAPATHRNGRTATIRAWAIKNGYPVKARGLIHSDVIAAYDASTTGEQE